MSRDEAGQRIDRWKQAVARVHGTL
jgi:hypothetical protein